LKNDSGLNSSFHFKKHRLKELGKSSQIQFAAHLMRRQKFVQYIKRMDRLPFT